MKKYYSLHDWNINSSTTLDVYPSASNIAFLKAIGCNVPIYLIEQIDVVLNKKIYFKNLFSNNGPFLVIFEPARNDVKRYGKINVISYDQIEKQLREMTNTHPKIRIIQQILKHKHSFAGAAISDGNGRLYVEIIRDTVDVRNLTSTGASPLLLDSIAYIDFYNLCVTPNHCIRSFREIIDITLHHKGYYEFAFGLIDSIPGVYFTSFSKNVLFQNLWNKYEIDFTSYLHHRLKSIFIRENGYLI